MVRFSIVPVLAVSAVCASVLSEQPRTETSWGRATGGLKLGIAASADDKTTGSSLDISFKNVGPNDLVLNLGHMLANGKAMLPDAVRVMLTRPPGPACELTYLDQRYAVIGGRLDDFIV